jgi:hypothetical protein
MSSKKFAGRKNEPEDDGQLSEKTSVIVRKKVLWAAIEQQPGCVVYSYGDIETCCYYIRCWVGDWWLYFDGFVKD